MTLSFEEYVLGQNESAVAQRMGTGLKIPSHDTPQNGAMVVREMATDILGVSLSKHPKLNTQDVFELRAILVAEIHKLLRDNLPGSKKPAEPSPLDVRTLGLTSDDAVKNYLQTHSIDINNEHHLSYLCKLILHAIEFYDEHVDSTNKIHADFRSIQTIEDIYKIFKAAAGIGAPRHHIPQACALLRIVFVMNYIKKDPILREIPAVMAHVNTMMTAHIVEEDHQEFYSSKVPGRKNIPLFHRNSREKTNASIVIKLLQKPDNDTANVMDGIGYLLVTESIGDVFRLIVEIFFDPRTAIFPAEHIRKIKNTLVSPDALRMIIDEYAQEPEKIFAAIDQLNITHGAQPDPRNGHSAADYAAVQITFNLPVHITDGDGSRIELFPVEFQFCHKDAYKKNSASHPAYRGNQLETVIARLNNNLSTGYADLEAKNDAVDPQ